MADVELDRSADGSSISPRVGDRILIRLPESPAGGYRWSAESIPDPVLALSASEFTAGPASRPGGGGMRAFAFDVRQAGTGELRLRLSRAWESESPAASEFSIQIRARDPE